MSSDTCSDNDVSGDTFSEDADVDAYKGFDGNNTHASDIYEGDEHVYGRQCSKSRTNPMKNFKYLKGGCSMRRITYWKCQRPWCGYIAPANKATCLRCKHMDLSRHYPTRGFYKSNHKSMPICNKRGPVFLRCHLRSHIRFEFVADVPPQFRDLAETKSPELRNVGKITITNRRPWKDGPVLKNTMRGGEEGKKEEYYVRREDALYWQKTVLCTYPDARVVAGKLVDVQEHPSTREAITVVILTRNKHRLVFDNVPHMIVLPVVNDRGELMPKVRADKLPIDASDWESSGNEGFGDDDEDDDEDDEDDNDDNDDNDDEDDEDDNDDNDDGSDDDNDDNDDDNDDGEMGGRIDPTTHRTHSTSSTVDADVRTGLNINDLSIFAHEEDDDQFLNEYSVRRPMDPQVVSEMDEDDIRDAAGNEDDAQLEEDVSALWRDVRVGAYNVHLSQRDDQNEGASQVGASNGNQSQSYDENEGQRQGPLTAQEIHDFLFRPDDDVAHKDVSRGASDVGGRYWSMSDDDDDEMTSMHWPYDTTYGSASLSTLREADEGVVPTTDLETNALLMTEHDVHPFVIARMVESINRMRHNYAEIIRERVRAVFDKEYREFTKMTNRTVRPEIRKDLIDSIFKDVHFKDDDKRVNPHASYRCVNKSSQRLKLQASINKANTYTRSSDDGNGASIFDSWLKLRRTPIYEVKVKHKKVEAVYAHVTSPILAVMVHVLVTTMLKSRHLMQGIVLKREHILRWLRQINQKYAKPSWADEADKVLSMFGFPRAPRNTPAEAVMCAEPEQIGIRVTSIAKVPQEVMRHLAPLLRNCRLGDRKYRNEPIDDTNFFSNVFEVEAYTETKVYTFISDVLEPNITRFESPALAAVAFLVSRWELEDTIRTVLANYAATRTVVHNNAFATNTPRGVVTLVEQVLSLSAEGNVHSVVAKMNSVLDDVRADEVQAGEEFFDTHDGREEDELPSGNYYKELVDRSMQQLSSKLKEYIDDKIAHIQLKVAGDEDEEEANNRLKASFEQVRAQTSAFVADELELLLSQIKEASRSIPVELLNNEYVDNKFKFFAKNAIETLIVRLRHDAQYMRETMKVNENRRLHETLGLFVAFLTEQLGDEEDLGEKDDDVEVLDASMFGVYDEVLEAELQKLEEQMKVRIDKMINKWNEEGDVRAQFEACERQIRDVLNERFEAIRGKIKERLANEGKAVDFRAEEVDGDMQKRFEVFTLQRIEGLLLALHKKKPHSLDDKAETLRRQLASVRQQRDADESARMSEVAATKRDREMKTDTWRTVCNYLKKTRRRQQEMSGFASHSFVAQIQILRIEVARMDATDVGLVFGRSKYVRRERSKRTILRKLNELEDEVHRKPTLNPSMVRLLTSIQRNVEYERLHFEVVQMIKVTTTSTTMKGDADLDDEIARLKADITNSKTIQQKDEFVDMLSNVKDDLQHGVLTHAVLHRTLCTLWLVLEREYEIDHLREELTQMDFGNENKRVDMLRELDDLATRVHHTVQDEDDINDGLSSLHSKLSKIRKKRTPPKTTTTTKNKTSSTAQASSEIDRLQALKQKVDDSKIKNSKILEALRTLEKDMTQNTWKDKEILNEELQKLDNRVKRYLSNQKAIQQKQARMGLMQGRDGEATSVDKGNGEQVSPTEEASRAIPGGMGLMQKRTKGMTLHDMQHSLDQVEEELGKELTELLPLQKGHATYFNTLMGVLQKKRCEFILSGYDLDSRIGEKTVELQELRSKIERLQEEVLGRDSNSKPDKSTKLYEKLRTQYANKLRVVMQVILVFVDVNKFISDSMTGAFILFSEYKGFIESELRRIAHMMRVVHSVEHTLHNLRIRQDRNEVEIEVANKHREDLNKLNNELKSKIRDMKQRLQLVIQTYNEEKTERNKVIDQLDELRRKVQEYNVELDMQIHLRTLDYDFNKLDDLRMQHDDDLDISDKYYDFNDTLYELTLELIEADLADDIDEFAKEKDLFEDVQPYTAHLNARAPQQEVATSQEARKKKRSRNLSAHEQARLIEAKQTRQTRMALLQFLGRRGGYWRIQPVAGDGACFYWSMICALNFKESVYFTKQKVKLEDTDVAKWPLHDRSDPEAQNIIVRMRKLREDVVRWCDDDEHQMLVGPAIAALQEEYPYLNYTTKSELIDDVYAREIHIIALAFVLNIRIYIINQSKGEVSHYVYAYGTQKAECRATAKVLDDCVTDVLQGRAVLLINVGGNHFNAITGYIPPADSSTRSKDMSADDDGVNDDDVPLPSRDKMTAPVSSMINPQVDQTMHDHFELQGDIDDFQINEYDNMLHHSVDPQQEEEVRQDDAEAANERKARQNPKRRPYVQRLKYEPQFREQRKAILLRELEKARASGKDTQKIQEELKRIDDIERGGRQDATEEERVNDMRDDDVEAKSKRRETTEGDAAVPTKDRRRKRITVKKLLELLSAPHSSKVRVQKVAADDSCFYWAIICACRHDGFQFFSSRNSSGVSASPMRSEGVDQLANRAIATMKSLRKAVVDWCKENKWTTKVKSGLTFIQEKKGLEKYKLQNQLAPNAPIEDLFIIAMAYVLNKPIYVLINAQGVEGVDLPHEDAMVDMKVRACIPRTGEDEMRKVADAEKIPLNEEIKAQVLSGRAVLLLRNRSKCFSAVVNYTHILYGDEGLVHNEEEEGRDRIEGHDKSETSDDGTRTVASRTGSPITDEERQESGGEPSIDNEDRGSRIKGRQGVSTSNGGSTSTRDKTTPQPPNIDEERRESGELSADSARKGRRPVKPARRKKGVGNSMTSVPREQRYISEDELVAFMALRGDAVRIQQVATDASCFYWAIICARNKENSGCEFFKKHNSSAVEASPLRFEREADAKMAIKTMTRYRQNVVKWCKSNGRTQTVQSGLAYIREKKGLENYELDDQLHRDSRAYFLLFMYAMACVLKQPIYVLTEVPDREKVDSERKVALFDTTNVRALIPRTGKKLESDLGAEVIPLDDEVRGRVLTGKAVLLLQSRSRPYFRAVVSQYASSAIEYEEGVGEVDIEATTHDAEKETRLREEGEQGSSGDDAENQPLINRARRDGTPGRQRRQKKERRLNIEELSDDGTAAAENEQHRKEEERRFNIEELSDDGTAAEQPAVFEVHQEQVHESTSVGASRWNKDEERGSGDDDDEEETRQRERELLIEQKKKADEEKIEAAAKLREMRAKEWIEQSERDRRLREEGEQNSSGDDAEDRPLINRAKQVGGGQRRQRKGGGGAAVRRSEKGATQSAVDGTPQQEAQHRTVVEQYMTEYEVVNFLTLTADAVQIRNVAGDASSFYWAIICACRKRGNTFFDSQNSSDPRSSPIAVAMLHSTYPQASKAIDTMRTLRQNVVGWCKSHERTAIVQSGLEFIRENKDYDDYNLDDQLGDGVEVHALFIIAMAYVLRKPIFILNEVNIENINLVSILEQRYDDYMFDTNNVEAYGLHRGRDDIKKGVSKPVVIPLSAEVRARVLSDKAVLLLRRRREIRKDFYTAVIVKPRKRQRQQPTSMNEYVPHIEEIDDDDEYDDEGQVFERGGRIGKRDCTDFSDEGSGADKCVERAWREDSNTSANLSREGSNGLHIEDIDHVERAWREDSNTSANLSREGSNGLHIEDIYHVDSNILDRMPPVRERRIAIFWPSTTGTKAQQRESRDRVEETHRAWREYSPLARAVEEEQYHEKLRDWHDNYAHMENSMSPDEVAYHKPTIVPDGYFDEPLPIPTIDDMEDPYIADLVKNFEAWWNEQPETAQKKRSRSARTKAAKPPVPTLWFEDDPSRTEEENVALQEEVSATRRAWQEFWNKENGVHDESEFVEIEIPSVDELNDPEYAEQVNDFLKWWKEQSKARRRTEGGYRTNIGDRRKPVWHFKWDPTKTRNENMVLKRLANETHRAWIEYSRRITEKYAENDVDINLVDMELQMPTNDDVNDPDTVAQVKDFVAWWTKQPKAPPLGSYIDWWSKPRSSNDPNELERRRDEIMDAWKEFYHDRNIRERKRHEERIAEWRENYNTEDENEMDEETLQNKPKMILKEDYTHIMPIDAATQSLKEEFSEWWDMQPQKPERRK